MHTNESKETQIQRWDLKRWVLRSFLNWLSLLASLISDGNEFQIYGAQCLNAFSVHFLLALGGIFNRFWEPDLNRRLGTYCSKRSLKYDGAVLFIHLKHKTQILQSILAWSGSQWSFLNRGVTWSLLAFFKTSLAAWFWMRWSLVIVSFGKLTNRELQ